MAKRYSESCNRLIVSKEKVEKVVNPPQKPIVKNIFSSGEMSSRASKKKMIKPSIKLPKIFTDNVP